MVELEIVLDKRESKLIQACKELVIPYKPSPLSLGDIHIRDKKTDEIKMMIERKTWRDLAASILDNRYKEQHARYREWARENNCSVWYILEGPQRFRTPAQEKRTLSAHISLCFDPHTNIVETKDPTETMRWIQRVVQKIHTKGIKWCINGFKQEISQNTLVDQVQIGGGCDKELAQQKVNKIGKKSHNLESTWIAMMSCIYGMSVDKAEAIIRHFKSVNELKQQFGQIERGELVKILKDIVVVESPKKRKLGQVLANRVVDVFCLNIVKVKQ